MTQRSGLFAFWMALCILLGGASAGGWLANGALQVMAILLILMTLWSPGPPLPRGARPLLWLAAGLAVLIVLTLIPLSPGLWTALPGREWLPPAYRLLELPLPSLPWSLDARRTVLSGLSLLPPLATFLLALSLTRDERVFTSKFLLWAAAGVVAFGAAQLFAGDGNLRPYQVTSPDRTVGTFANPNHLATLLLMVIPFAAFLIGRSLGSRRGRAGGKAVVWVALALFLCIGVAVNGSLAGYGLLLPTTFFAYLVFRHASGKFRSRDLLLGVVGLVAFAGLSLLGPFNDQSLQDNFEEGPQGRKVSIPTTVDAAQTFFPAGSGLGTFRDVYRRFEDPNSVSSTFVNHAHNDYVEWALELGLPGLLLLLGALAWAAWYAFRAWRADFHGANLARAASVSLGVVILHSLVDYPVRTATIASLAALCCAFLLQPPAARRKSDEDATADTGARHISVT